MRGTINTRIAYLFVNISFVIWSTNFILGRMLRDSVGPVTLGAARFCVAAAAVSLALMRHPPEERRPGKQWPLLLAMGLTGVFGYNILAYAGLSLTTATNAALINGTTPLILSLLAALVLRERLSPWLVGGALISLGGVVVIVSRGSWEALWRLQFNVGDLLILVSVAVWGVYSIFSRIATRTRTTVAASGLSIWIGLPLLLIAAAFEWQHRPPTINGPILLAILWIGIGPAFIALLTWNEGVRRIGPARAAAFYNMLPVFGTLLGVLILKEPFGWPQLAGGMLVIGGSLTSAWPDLRRSG